METLKTIGSVILVVAGVIVYWVFLAFMFCLFLFVGFSIIKWLFL